MEFKDWKSMLNSVLIDGPNSECYYMVRIDDDRSHFLNHKECIEFIRSRMKSNILGSVMDSVNRWR
jgi:hypothetical protein